MSRIEDRFKNRLKYIMNGVVDKEEKQLLYALYKHNIKNGKVDIYCKGPMYHCARTLLILHDNWRINTILRFDEQLRYIVDSVFNRLNRDKVPIRHKLDINSDNIQLYCYDAYGNKWNKQWKIDETINCSCKNIREALIEITFYASGGSIMTNNNQVINKCDTAKILVTKIYSTYEKYGLMDII